MSPNTFKDLRNAILEQKAFDNQINVFASVVVLQNEFLLRINLLLSFGKLRRKVEN